MADEPVRFTDILTTAAAVSNYVGQPTVTATHLLDAIAILREEKTMENLGRPMSPFLGRAMGTRGEVEPPVRELAQRWFARLGSSINAELEGDELAALIEELRALAAATDAS
ncbi:MAG: hypothetical protein M0R74_15015 [Dehalococcoidia bacterium]|nr:hypothetical protein [Dehalococcoidia bacterium]